MKARVNGGVSARPPKRAREAACAPRIPALLQTGLGPGLIDINAPATTITGQ